jgi:hypothetical protein
VTWRACRFGAAVELPPSVQFRLIGMCDDVRRVQLMCGRDRGCFCAVGVQWLLEGVIVLVADDMLLQQVRVTG